jgi:hypothetical protein
VDAVASKRDDSGFADVMAIQEINEGHCLRCSTEIAPDSWIVKCGTYPQLLFWTLCQDCWNEIVLMDTKQREKRLWAVDGVHPPTEVRGW